MTPGTVLYAEVGGNGSDGSIGPSAGTGAGGANGGGSGGGSGGTFAAGGGGASDVRTSPASVALTSTDSRLIIAGGGGGAAHRETSAVDGGSGGGDTGGGGVSTPPGCGALGGGPTAPTSPTIPERLAGSGRQRRPVRPRSRQGRWRRRRTLRRVWRRRRQLHHVPQQRRRWLRSLRCRDIQHVVRHRLDGRAVGHVHLRLPPTIAIGSPGPAASYTQHQVVTSGYSCTPGAGTTVASCVGPVASGVQLDTSSVGQHTFTVIASDADGGTATASATYTVTSPPPPPPPPSKPQLSHIGDAGGQSHAGKATFTFTLNESARVTFTFVRKVSGRKVKGHCVTPTRKNLHKPKCTFTQSSKVTVSGRTGSNTLNLTVKKLPAGHYTVLSRRPIPRDTSGGARRSASRSRR